MNYCGRMTDEIRLSDAGALTALAHPFRRRLLDSLSADGPSTVGQLAARTGQAVGSVSHHLKVLAAAGLVNEAPELARDRREHWWRRVASISWGGSTDSPALQTAIEAATDVAFSRQVELFAGYRADQESAPDWSDAAFASDGWLRLTPDELDQLGKQMTAVIHRWHDRAVPEDSQDRASVFVFARGFPARP